MPVKRKQVQKLQLKAQKKKTNQPPMKKRRLNNNEPFCYMLEQIQFPVNVNQENSITQKIKFNFENFVILHNVGIV